jgi:multidrug efflux pump subunit AcrB
MSHKSDNEYVAQTHNTARFFTEHRQVAFVLLIAVALWGWYGYQHMPKRKDPQIPIRVAVASTQWPGASAEEVEQLVSRPIEQTVAQNPFIKAPLPSDFGIRSISFPGLSLVYVQLDDSVTDTKKQFADINLKLNVLNDRLPQGGRSHPVQQRLRRYRGSDVDSGKSPCRSSRYRLARQGRRARDPEDA